MKDKIIAGLMVIGAIGLALLMSYGMDLLGAPNPLWLMRLIGVM